MRRAICGLLLAVCTVPATGMADGPSGRQPAIGVATWTPDTLLSGFWAHTIDLGQDYDGAITATVVRRPKQRVRDCAVLYIHGYVDYFLQPHLADFYEQVPVPGAARTGCDFFALDLRKYGRSLPAKYGYPNFAKSLDEYFEEITQALAFVTAERYPFVLLNGHSTGGLVAVRYLQNGASREAVNALFLNSPFLDFSDRDLSGFRASVARTIGWLAPHASTRSTVPSWYVLSLLRQSDACPECRGRWDFLLRLKPIEGFPVYFGWVRAILMAQDRARQGGIPQPILVLHSARSNDGTGAVWQDAYRRTDLVLDVEDIKRDSRKLGHPGNVRIRAIEGGVHDLSLSDPDAQGAAFAEVTAWLRGLR